MNTTWNQEKAIMDYMAARFPAIKHWTMKPGNDCIWVYWNTNIPMNLYFTFMGDAIAQVYMD
jgi:hypothetical protein